MEWSLLLSSFFFCTVLYRFLCRFFLAEFAPGPQPAKTNPQESCPQASGDDIHDSRTSQGRYVEVMPLPPTTTVHRSNPQESLPFDSDLCRGRYLMCHPPTSSKEAPGDLNYADYFAGKRCLWEFRVQLEFKRKPEPADFFFGIEMEEYVPTNSATKVAASAFVAALKKIIGGALYHSFGDDPRAVDGELEKPQCVFPFWAWDQFIVTPESETPPSLTDVDFPMMGYNRRSMGLRDYTREVEALTSNFQEGPTYTFALRFFSHFVDVVNWQMVGLPLISPIDFNMMCGSPPVHLQLYSIKPDSKEKRHLASRKTFCFHVALWSSNRRPTCRHFKDLVGSGRIGAEDAIKPPSRTGPLDCWEKERQGCLTAPTRNCSDCSVL